MLTEVQTLRLNVIKLISGKFSPLQTDQFLSEAERVTCWILSPSRHEQPEDTADKV